MPKMLSIKDVYGHVDLASACHLLNQFIYQQTYPSQGMI